MCPIMSIIFGPKSVQPENLYRVTFKTRIDVLKNNKIISGNFQQVYRAAINATTSITEDGDNIRKN